MSEYINNTEQRINELYDFAIAIINHGKGIDLIVEYENAIDNVQPFDVVCVVDKLMLDKIELADLKNGD